MRLGKKGDLALSTNAIVVLIIAVIILGLIITFITQGFSAVSDKFLAEAEKMPDPPVPGPSNPVTVTENMRVNSGDKFAFKVSVYNTGTSPQNFKPVFSDGGSGTCAAASSLASGTKNIASHAYATYIILGTASTSSSKYVCTVKPDTTNQNTNSADFVVEVK